MRTNAQLLMFFLILVVAIFGLFACDRSDRVQAAGEEDRDEILAPSERDFLTTSAHGHRAEIQFSSMALSSTSDAEVRDFANMIVMDHEAALRDLADLTKEENIPMPASVNDETKVDMERLTALSGAEFDREYANLMVASHEKTLSMLRDQSNSAQDEDVRGYVENLIPKVEMHLQKAQSLQSRLFNRRAS